jgi:hypothetical protein
MLHDATEQVGFDPWLPQILGHPPNHRVKSFCTTAAAQRRRMERHGEMRELRAWRHERHEVRRRRRRR